MLLLDIVKIKKYKSVSSVELSKFWRFLEILPFYAFIYIAVIGMVSVLLLLLDYVNLNIALIASTIIYIPIIKLVTDKYPTELPGSLKERRLFTLLSFVLVLAWGIFNIFYVSENVYIHRDPAIYSNAAVWLTNNDNLRIESSDSFGDIDEITPSSSGIESFGDDRSTLYVQAPHLFPVLLSYFGLIFGVNAIHYSNVFISMLSLLSIYSLARFFLRPVFAILPMILVAVSLPMIYFSRDTFTEPLTLMLIFSSIISFIIVFKDKKYLNKRFLFLSGALAAASSMVRVDAYLVVIAVIFAAFLGIISRKYNVRESIKYFLSFCLGALGIVLISWLDLTKLSPQYYNTLHTEIISQLILLIFIVSVCSILVVVLARNGAFLKFIKNKKNQNYLLYAFTIILVSAFIYLISRPLWLQTQKVYSNNIYVEYLQRNLGYSEIDGTLFYAENTHLWIVWYLGVAILPLSFIGIWKITRDYIKNNEVEKIAFVILTLSMSVLYFNYPAITPDQIWASRRFLPVIFPALAVFSFIGLYYLYKIVPRVRFLKTALIVFIIMLLFYQPIITSMPFIKHKEYAGFWEQIEKICNVIPKEKAVLVAGPNGRDMSFPIKARCNLEVEKLINPTTEVFRKAKENALNNGFDIVVLSVGHNYDLLPRGSRVTTISDTPYSEVERTLERKPERLNYYRNVIFMSSVDSEGKLIEYKN